MTADDARALHDAIERRNDAWNRLDSAVRMPPRQIADEKVAEAGDRFAATERHVLELVGVLENNVEYQQTYLGGWATSPRPMQSAPAPEITDPVQDPGQPTAGSESTAAKGAPRKGNAAGEGTAS